MNKVQGHDLQFLGFLGIFKESFKIIFKWRKIFSQITLAFIFPYSCIALANVIISTLLSNKIAHNTFTLNNTRIDSPSHNEIYNLIFSEWMVYSLINIAYFVLSLIFFLLCVSAVVYTIACIYVDSTIITFKKVLRIVPKVWKRVIVTYLCIFCVILATTFIYFILIMFLLVLGTLFAINKSNDSLSLGIPIAVIIISAILFIIGIFYMCIIWMLAFVISVLENHCGFEAMKKSKALMKGKMVTAIAIFLILGIASLPSQFFLKQFRESQESFGRKFWYGILTLLWTTFLSLLHLVVQTILYFVCKSYHHESVEKSSLAEHLEGYYGEYTALNTKSLQLEDLNV